MAIEKIQLTNVTVFDDLYVEFSDGINVFVGENGVGKTHLMKLLYSACQSVNSRISFQNKIVNCFYPDEHKISRLVSRKNSDIGSLVKVFAYDKEKNINKTLSLSFDKHTKWDSDVKGEDEWEKCFGNMSSVFIPAKEILSNCYNLQAAVDKNNVRFDDTYIDIINSAKIDITVDEDKKNSRDEKLKKIEKLISGKVQYDIKKDQFYLKSGRTAIEFNLVAEGIRKMGLLWQLVKNGMLEKGAVLFWDEPEANVNPVNIPEIVDILIMLKNEGVQIFVSTHDYVFSKYLELRARSEDIMFYSFYKNNDRISVDSSMKFMELKNNPIENGFMKLLDEVYDSGV